MLSGATPLAHGLPLGSIAANIAFVGSFGLPPRRPLSLMDIWPGWRLWMYEALPPCRALDLTE
jgi:hypothetical protein